MAKSKDPEAQKRKEEIKKADVRLLAQLGYKQEFKRDFKPLEVRIAPFNASLMIDNDNFDCC
jgi:hypothetical protein